MRALLPLVLLLGACDDPCKAGPEPTLQTGTGLLDFTPLADGDPVELVYGPQGGYHVEMAFQTTYLQARDLVAGTLTGRLDETAVFTATPWFQLQCEADVQVATGVRLFLVGDPEAVLGQPITVDVLLTDTEGSTLTDSVVVVPTASEGS